MYRIIMAEKPWELMRSYTELQYGEVACFGYATLEPEHKAVYIDEVFLVPQFASPSEVDFFTEGLPFAIEKAIADDRVDDLRFCIHSHGTYGTTFSKTDDDMIEKVGSTGTPWFVSAIFNKDGDSNARLDVFEIPPFGRTHVKFDKLPITKERSVEWENARIDELERFVKEPPKPAPKPKQIMSPSAQQKAFADNQGKTVKVDDMDDDELAEVAQMMGWSWSEDSDGRRWYFDDTGVITVSGPSFEHSTSQYSPGV